jgi:hypothetical protein
MTNFSSISLLPVVLPLVFYAMTYDQLDCIMRWLGRTEDGTGTFEKKRDRNFPEKALGYGTGISTGTRVIFYF